jgi:hypothetical protein
MLSPRLTNCPECANIPSLLKKIDCKLAELGNSLYNNISYMLNQPIPAGDILQLIAYRRILMHKYCNPNYVHEYSVAMIASRVIRITVGCVSRCNELERCLEEPCDITIVPNPSTTSTSTLAPITTTTTSSSSSTTSTTTTILNCCTSPTNLVLPGDSILLDGVNLTFSSTQPAGLSIWTNPIVMLPACLPPQTLNTVLTGGFDGTVDWDYTITFDTLVNNVKIQVINYSADYATYDVQEKITFTTNTNIPEVINCDGCNVIIENNSIIAVQDTNGSGTFIINAATSYTSLTLTPSILGLNPFGYAVDVFLRICGFTSPTSTTTTTSSSSSTTTTTTTTICQDCIAYGFPNPNDGNGTGTINGITVTTTYTGPSINAPGPRNNYNNCAGFPMDADTLYIAQLTGAFTLTISFSSPVNDVYISNSAMGYNLFPGQQECFTVNSDQGTPTLTLAGGCYDYGPVGNQICGSHQGGNTGGATRVSTTIPYSQLTITGTGIGNLAGYGFDICFPSCNTTTTTSSTSSTSTTTSSTSSTTSTTTTLAPSGIRTIYTHFEAL